MLKRDVVQVVAGILYDEHGRFLLSSRPHGKVYAGYWEFAGGKIEPHETRLAALQREFDEELGITIHAATPWLTQVFDYEHARVQLYFYRIYHNQWQGVLHAKEHQQWCWQHPFLPTASPILPANQPILDALKIPSCFSGSLKQGLNPIQHKQYPHYSYPQDFQACYPLQPYIENQSLQTQMNEQSTGWQCIESVEQLPIAQRHSQVVVWAISDEQTAQQCLNRLQEGIAIPLIPLAPDDLFTQYGIHWLHNGAHGLALQID